MRCDPAELGERFFGGKIRRSELIADDSRCTVQTSRFLPSPFPSVLLSSFLPYLFFFSRRLPRQVDLSRGGRRGQGRIGVPGGDMLLCRWMERGGGGCCCCCWFWWFWWRSWAEVKPGCGRTGTIPQVSAGSTDRRALPCWNLLAASPPPSSSSPSPSSPPPTPEQLLSHTDQCAPHRACAGPGGLSEGWRERARELMLVGGGGSGWGSSISIIALWCPVCMAKWAAVHLKRFLLLVVALS